MMMGTTAGIQTNVVYCVVHRANNDIVRAHKLIGVIGAYRLRPHICVFVCPSPSYIVYTEWYMYLSIDDDQFIVYHIHSSPGYK